MSKDYIDLTFIRTSTFSLPIIWGEDITGWTFIVDEVFPATMEGAFTCSVTDGPAGIATLSADWSDLWPSGSTGYNLVTLYVKPSAYNGALPQFRIRLI